MFRAEHEPAPRQRRSQQRGQFVDWLHGFKGALSAYKGSNWLTLFEPIV